jgi:hypothetical protein
MVRDVENEAAFVGLKHPAADGEAAVGFRKLLPFGMEVRDKSQVGADLLWLRGRFRSRWVEPRSTNADESVAAASKAKLAELLSRLDRQPSQDCALVAALALRRSPRVPRSALA